MEPFFAAALVVLAIASFIYEVYQLATGGPTITEQLRWLGRAWPPLLFLAGLLSGHLWAC